MLLNQIDEMWRLMECGVGEGYWEDARRSQFG
jgi:hypothetical protein